MVKKELQTPKGFRDFLPSKIVGRNFLLEKLTTSLKKFGFDQLETPALEFAETLKGKYGEDEKLIFEFADRGGRRVALRYDQTVPLARVVAANVDIIKPFKRFQIQPVWRADNPQKGRYREFLQVDFDIVGSDSLIADAETIMATINATKAAGFDKFVLKINDRDNFQGLPIEAIRSIDKLQKIGEVGVLEQLKRSGYDEREAKSLLDRIRSLSPSRKVKDLFDLLENCKLEKDKYAYDPTLARGLDYYTGIIYELEIEGFSGGSVGGGGRYDNLIESFSGKKTPAVGFSFGFDRIMDAAIESKVVPPYSPPTKVLVTIFDKKLLPDSLSLTSKLRDQEIATEISLDSEEKLDKQLKYADNRGIPFAIIIGPNEAKTNTVTLKDLSSGEQSKMKTSELLKKLKG